MALPDIKDAGILSGFTRWGWPWHGLIAGATIGATGKAHPQPSVNESWLIDRSLPALDIAPATVASEAAAGREWRNYALIPGGYAYGTAIGAETFIHIDTAGDAWRIALAYSFPALQTLRITATITRFGKLIVSSDPVVPVSVTKTVDVVCTEIELLNAVSQQSGVGVAYGSRIGRLEDVWTNGSKALVSVVMRDSGITTNDLFAVVTLTPGGAGGTDGSGLTLSAVETIAQPALTPGVVNVGISTPAIYGVAWSVVSTQDTACDGADGATYTRTYADSGLSSDPILSTAVQSNGTIYARYAYYKSDGTPVAARLRLSIEVNDVVTAESRGAVINPVTVHLCFDSSTTSPDPYVVINATVRTVREEGYWLMENDAIVDKMVWETTSINDYERIDYAEGGFEAWSLLSSAVTVVPQGSLASWFPASIEVFLNQNSIPYAFRLASDSAYTDAVTIEHTDISLGVHRMKGKAAAFLAKNTGSSAYGTAMTPPGPLAVGLLPASSTNFAWQRKTGDYTFAANPICYV